MSYASQQFLVVDNSSTANFDAWGSAIHNAIAAMGWTQTADTGQVNWGSSPAVPSSAYLYEIWQPADALQTGSTKYYVKIEYGYNSTTPRIQITIGTGTNGSGTITGYTKGPFYYSGSNKGSTLYDCYFSGDVDRWTMVLWRNSGVSFGFTIERTKDVTGANSSDGVMFALGYLAGGAPTNNAVTSTIIFGVGVGQSYGSMPFVLVDYNGVPRGSPTNNSVPISPAFIEYGKMANPFTTVVYASNNFVVEGEQVQITIYGVVHTFVFSIFVGGNIPSSNVLVGWRFD